MTTEKKLWYQRADTWIGAGMMALSVAMILYTRARKFRSLMGLNPGAFPIVVFAVFGLCGLMVLVSALRGQGMQKVNSIRWVRALVTIIAVLAYTYAIEWIGFVLATFLFMVLLLYFYEERDWKKLLLISAGVAVVIFLLFTYAFQIPLPALFL